MTFTKVMLDAGHGGRDSGAVGISGLREKDVVLPVVLLMRDRLQSGGITVSTTRDSDVYLSLAERREMTNESGAEIFASIHCNAGGGFGYEVFTTVGDTQADPFATHLFGEYGREFPERRGRADRSDVDTADPDKERNFAVLLCKPPATLFELGFIDTAEGERFLGDEGNQEKMARALVRGIFNFGEISIAREDIKLHTDLNLTTVALATIEQIATTALIRLSL